MTINRSYNLFYIPCGIILASSFAIGLLSLIAQIHAIGKLQQVGILGGSFLISVPLLIVIYLNWKSQKSQQCKTLKSSGSVASLNSQAEASSTLYHRYTYQTSDPFDVVIDNLNKEGFFVKVIDKVGKFLGSGNEGAVFEINENEAIKILNGDATDLNNILSAAYRLKTISCSIPCSKFLGIGYCNETKRWGLLFEKISGNTLDKEIERIKAMTFEEKIFFICTGMLNILQAVKHLEAIKLPFSDYCWKNIMVNNEKQWILVDYLPKEKIDIATNTAFDFSHCIFLLFRMFDIELSSIKHLSKLKKITTWQEMERSLLKAISVYNDTGKESDNAAVKKAVVS